MTNDSSKNVLITGASSGIGKSIAKELARDRYGIAVNYLNDKSGAEQTVNEIRNSGGQAVCIQGDVGNLDDVNRIFAEFAERLGPIDALINNASCRFGIGENFENIPMEAIERVFKANTYGVFAMCQSAIRIMKKEGGGVIINLSSETAKFGGNKMPHFAASKAAVNALTIALAREVGEFNIRVNAISPGLIDTPIQQTQSEEKIRELVESTPMKRMGRPVEIANTVKWLISEEASYVSGTIISVTGGR